MDRESTDILIAVTRPVRGREMMATAIPTDMFEPIKLASAKRTSRDEALTSDLSRSRTDNAEIYYEGYVDGKKYLVPDSNLEAMKDMINLRMRQRRSTRFRHQTSADTADLEMTPDKIEKMLAKIRNLSFSISDGKSGASSKSGEPTKIREERVSKQWSKMSSLTKEGNGSTSKSGASSKSGEPTNTREERVSKQWSQLSSLAKDDERSNSKSSTSKIESEPRSEPLESPPTIDDVSLPESFLSPTEKSLLSEEFVESKEQQTVFEREEEESDDCYLRLILSGHFKDNEKPIYIIQEYSTKSNLFSKQSADFTSSQTQGNVHIFMAGKLFNENILEETDGKPTSLNLKPNKIMIDASKCKIFRSYFESTYSRKATDITIKGEFLRNERSMDITPYLSLTLKHKNVSLDSREFNNEKESEEKRPSILVKNRQSLISSSTEISKDTKKVSFKDSFDDEEVYVIFTNMKKKKVDDFLPIPLVNNSKKEHNLQNWLNKNEKSSGHKQIVAKKTKVLERILFLFTENSLFKKFFTKGK